MEKLTAYELDFIYSVMSAKLEKCICDGLFGLEDEVAQLHLCMAKLITMEAAARKGEDQERTTG